ncbi:MAG: hypothetical protein ACREXW_00980 [Gammaproteobacteria bacterium]
MALWQDLAGTLGAYIKVGLSGVRLKNSSGHLLVRNSGDSADAEITASKVKVSGEILEINSDAAGSGADWKYSLQRPASGMGAAVVLTLPVDDGTPDQVLKTDGSGVLSWVSAGNTALAKKVDTTTLAFNSSSPLAMFTTGANDVNNEVRITIDTPFDGTPSVSIGISGTTSKYMGATDVDLTQPAGTVFIVHPGKAAQGAEALIATYSAGGASAGSARIEVDYDTPA